MIAFSLLYDFLLSLKLIIYLCFVCLLNFLCIDHCFIQTLRGLENIFHVFKHTQYSASFVGSVVFWGLPFIIFLEISFPFLLCLHPTYSSSGVYSLSKNSKLVTELGLRSPAASVRILTGNWMCDLGQVT